MTARFRGLVTLLQLGVYANTMKLHGAFGTVDSRTQKGALHPRYAECRSREEPGLYFMEEWSSFLVHIYYSRRDTSFIPYQGPFLEDESGCIAEPYNSESQAKRKLIAPKNPWITS